MTQYNSLNVRLSKSQLNKLKSAIKNETDVVLRISSNMIEIQMMRIMQIFVKLLLKTHQLILNCQISII